MKGIKTLILPRPTALRNLCWALVAAVLLFSEVAAVSYSRTLTEILSGSFDTLKKEHIKHSPVKRSISSIGLRNKALHFESFGRKFNLRLIPDHSIFSPDFTARSVNDDEEDLEIKIDKDSFLTGYIEGDLGSKVQAHLEDGILTANIEAHDEVYVVEPSSRHVDGAHDFDMIVYKVSNIRSNLTSGQSSKSHPSFCGVKDHQKEHKEMTSDNIPGLSEMLKQRERRATPSASNLDTCQLALVADHLFVQHMGQGKKSTAINYMLSVIQRVDQIYRSTSWNGQLTNIGFEVREVIVHDKPSGIKGPEYNQIKTKAFSEEELLKAFSKGNWRSFCLAHLFTYQDFPHGVIGVAYVAVAKIESPAGICGYKGSGSSTYFNIGLSSSMNWGRRLLTSEADVVTSHELGHNFGADHDPFTNDCSPSESKGGKYMMHSTSVSGLQPNNKKFSPCSLKSIYEVLNKKRKFCFKSKVGQYCGNFEVEENTRDPSKSEDCDVGIKIQLNATDKCCQKNCKFQPGAKCSDSNKPCCENCQFASKAKRCRESFPLACQGETYCNGLSADCPEAPLLSGVACSFSKGMCLNGVCKTLCEQYKKTSCICTESNKKCKICCRNMNSTDACAPIIVNGTDHNVNDGGPCDTGTDSASCVQGKCKKTQQNVFDQFLSLLKDFTASKFARFMQDNIVGTILIFSLFVWIPGSCIVHYVDKRRARKERDRTEWQDIHNSDLIHRNSQNVTKNVFRNSQNKNRKSPNRSGQKRQPDAGLEVTDGREISM